jgi:hypothetical protein
MRVNLHLIIPDHVVSAMKKGRYHVIFESIYNSIISRVTIIFLINLASLSLVDCADAQLIWSDDFEQNVVGDTAIGWTTKCDTPFVGTWVIADDSTKVYRFEGESGESFASTYPTPSEYIARAEVKITSFNSPSLLGEVMAGIQAGVNIMCYYSALDHFEGSGLYFSDK